MNAVSPARTVAARVLNEIESNPRSQAAELLSHYARQEQLREDDSRLARAIVFGVLRHAPTLDYYYAPYLKQSPHKLQPQLRLLIRMAAAQQFLLNKIPSYAIVNETVSLARTQFRMKPPQIGFLNALLRKLVANDASLPALPAGNRISDLSIRYGLPAEYVRLLVEKYGTHKAIEIMAALKTEPPINLRVNLLQTTGEQLTAALTGLGFEVEPATITADSLVIRTPSAEVSLFETEEFRAGHFYVQDEASQLVAHVVAPQPGEDILDLCSAPGGKTTHMAELAGGKANITATDLSAERLQLVEENVKRLQTPGVTITTPEAALGADRQYDAVLVDAPCSGSGTVRRNPEIAWRLNDDALAHHASRQAVVLGTAATHVRPGGRLIYSTCSISNQENKAVTASFLREHPGFQIDPVETALPGEKPLRLLELRTPEGTYQTWPAHPDIDGFEAVVFRRK